MALSSQSFVPASRRRSTPVAPTRYFEGVCLQKRHCMHQWLSPPIVRLDQGCRITALLKIGNRSEDTVRSEYYDASPFGTWTKTKHTDSLLFILSRTCNIPWMDAESAFRRCCELMGAAARQWLAVPNHSWPGKDGRCVCRQDRTHIRSLN